MTFHVSLGPRGHFSADIYRQVRRAIRDGRLRPGDRLPPSRILARTLSVSRMTVTIAYERLAGEGFVASRVGSGTVVSPHAARPDVGLRQPSSPASALRPREMWDGFGLPAQLPVAPRFDFRTGVPDGALFPHRTWRRLVAHAVRAEAETSGRYADPAGERALREAIARHVGTARGVDASPDDVTITNGTQQALDIVARVLAAPGDAVVVEDPGYRPPRRLFESLGLRVAGVPVDTDGLVTDLLPRRARFAYVTPSHQYPLGVSMALARRHALLTWAERHDAAIVEDDYDSEFRFGGRPLEPLQTLDRAGRVIYVGSFSKTVLPALRVGFLVTPRPITDAVRKAKFLTDWHTPTLAQTALARFLDDGGFGRHVRRAGVAYRQRHAALLDALERHCSAELEVIPSATGLHITARARVASIGQMIEVERHARGADVLFQPLSSFAVGDAALPGVVLGYGGIATADVDEGIRRLRAAFDTAAARR